MNDIIRAMEQRRSIRRFKPDMPAKEDLEQIIEAGLYAANGMGHQSAIIVAVTNKELRDKISALNCRIGGPSTARPPCSSFWRRRTGPTGCTMGAWSWAT